MRTTAKTTSTSTRRRPTESTGPVVISTGCPSGIGPEVAVAAAAALSHVPCVLLGDEGVLHEAARLRRVAARRLAVFAGEKPAPGISVAQVGARLAPEDFRPGRPTPAGGAAQLAYVEAAYSLSKQRGWPLVTGPVSKEVIATSGVRRARRFRGHTEWLEELDGADHSVMCFAAKSLVTSLVTTHVPLGRVPRLLTPQRVATSTWELVELLRSLGHDRPKIAVCSLNPHAGEGELLGSEERRAIVPAVEWLRRRLRRRAEIFGPLGAETAYRKAHGGVYDGVVAMYHDQATIPMKLVAFGEAVNVTQGLSIVRTSVDHGTGYDIAGQGSADARGMRSAIELATALARHRGRRRKPETFSDARGDAARRR